jgi:hypothetical protein
VKNQKHSYSNWNFKSRDEVTQFWASPLSLSSCACVYILTNKEIPQHRTFGSSCSIRRTNVSMPWSHIEVLILISTISFHKVLVLIQPFPSTKFLFFIQPFPSTKFLFLFNHFLQQSSHSYSTIPFNIHQSKISTMPKATSTTCMGFMKVRAIHFFSFFLGEEMEGHIQIEGHTNLVVGAHDWKSSQKRPWPWASE